MDDDSLMPFGKFKGKKLSEIPARYLLWGLREDVWKGDLLEYVKSNEVLLLEEAEYDIEPDEERN